MKCNAKLRYNATMFYIKIFFQIIKNLKKMMIEISTTAPFIDAKKFILEAKVPEKCVLQVLLFESSLNQEFRNFFQGILLERNFLRTRISVLLESQNDDVLSWCLKLSTLASVNVIQEKAEFVPVSEHWLCCSVALSPEEELGGFALDEGTNLFPDWKALHRLTFIELFKIDEFLFEYIHLMTLEDRKSEVRCLDSRLFPETVELFRKVKELSLVMLLANEQRRYALFYQSKFDRFWMKEISSGNKYFQAVTAI